MGKKYYFAVNSFEDSIMKSSTDHLILFLNRIIKTSFKNNNMALTDTSKKVLDKLKKLLKLQYDNIEMFNNDNEVQKDMEDESTATDVFNEIGMKSNILIMVIAPLFTQKKYNKSATTHLIYLMKKEICHHHH